ncbi:MAG: OmpA family protein [Flavobacteriales bacterium]|nr:OmpA family protein [Flavobacteriales bacterium]MCB0410224.1 OmpA family protein [Flavobacteriales bacterium]MCB9175092.1 OmpA family protein [Flavobacteriales bacterium]
MKHILIFISLLLSTILFSQTNLVPNHDFNKIGKKVKEKGQINMAEPWISPTLTQADLYIKNTKSGEIAIDGNSYGAEDPMEGDNYAGLLAYSYKGKVSRSYLQVKLTEPLKQDEEYCVTFHVSLADLSKYACNYLGAYLSNDAVSANNNDVFQFEPQILSRRLTVYEQQYYWTPVCAKYKAKGGEEFLTIGNFTPEEKLTINKVKRPQGFNSPQTNDAYYYIDNVIVTSISGDEKCDCDFIPGVDDMETVNKSFKSDLNNQSNQPKILNSDGNVTATKTKSGVSSMNYTIFFESKQMNISASATKKMDDLITYLKTNPKDSVSLDGYIDESEKDEDKLDGKRVGVVYKYIVSKGIVKERIIKSMQGVAEDKDKTKNMKVEITIKKP